MSNDDKTIIEEQQLGYNENIVLYGFNQNQPIMAKIDTGADMCCLHATNISVSGNTVSFSYNNQQYRMPLDSTMDVQQADSGNNSRPVVKFAVIIDDVNLSDVQFNLNDRSQMDSDILIGRNLLDVHQFTIVTGKNASESVEMVTSTPSSIDCTKSEKIQDIIESMEQYKITFDDLLEGHKIKTINTLDSITY